MGAGEEIAGAGFAVIRAVLPAGLCAHALADVRAELALDRVGSRPALPIASPLHRRDTMLELSPAVHQVTCSIAENAEFQAAVSGAGMDRTAALFELASLVSYPGAGAQPVHRDTVWSEVGLLPPPARPSGRRRSCRHAHPFEQPPNPPVHL